MREGRGSNVISFNEPEEDLALLADLLQSRVGSRVEKAALESLTATRSPRVAGLLLAGWPQHGPSLRLSIISALLSRAEWTSVLLDAVAGGTVGASEVPMSGRQELVRHADAGIRRRAAELLPAAGGDRAKVVAKFKSVADLRGDGVKGVAIFNAACAACHTYIGRGVALGPDLKTFYNKSVQDFLVAILDPNAVVEGRYMANQVQTWEGRALTGVITGETATGITLGQAGGAKETLLRSDIREMRASALSLMPEGLEQALSPQDLADLIAFLKSGG